MAVVDTAMATVHLLTAAAWVGSVVYFAGAVLPAARDGELDAAPVESMAKTLTNWSRGASAVMLLTGGYLVTARGYSVESLTGSPRGHAVLGMAVLWLVFTGVVEVSRGRLVDGLRERKVREPARKALPWYRAAAVVGLLLLVDAGYLIG